ncbi:MAG: cytochrome c [Rubrivivax sp.]|nr:cytochrome c [Rubrivivax sp.]
MKLPLSLSELLIAGIVVSGIGIAAWQAIGPRADARMSSAATVRVPALSPQAVAGRHAFDANCALCHGERGAGTGQGPPLVHDIYNPGHHADESFLRAVRQGVPQHHWPFGDMPALPQVSDAQIADIVRYVRELQQANGIVRRPHRM